MDVYGLISATYAHIVPFVFIIFVVLLCGVLAAVAYLLSLTTAQDTEKRSEYECGFAPFDSATRHPFEVHFYVVGILFLIFDVEIALLFPWAVTVEATGVVSYIAMFQFVYILAVGFHYEWQRGALIWPARYSPSRLTFASAKWFSLLLFVTFFDLPFEVFLAAAAVKKNDKKEDKDAGYPFTYLSRWRGARPRTHNYTFGPFPENSGLDMLRRAISDGALPIFGPHPRFVGPRTREAAVFSYNDAWAEERVRRTVGAYLVHRIRWRHAYEFGLFWKKYTRLYDPAREVITKARIWNYWTLHIAIAIVMAAMLVVISLVWDAFTTDFQITKRAFILNVKSANLFLSRSVDMFAELPKPFQLTISFFVMCPVFIVRYTIAHWIPLLVATVIWTRALFYFVFRRFGTFLRSRKAVRREIRRRRLAAAARLASVGGVDWWSIPTKFHPDKGQTDEQHNEYVHWTGATNRTMDFLDKNRYWAPVALLAFDSPDFMFYALAQAVDLSKDLFLALLPETTLLVMIVYLIKVVGVELGRRRSKKALAIETLDAAQEAVIFTFWLYLLQVHFTWTTPILGGYFFWTIGLVALKGLVVLTSCFVFYVSQQFIRRTRRHLLEYPLMLLLATLFLLCLVGANNLMAVFLSLGGCSIALYVLIVCDVYARVSREASMKYFYLSAMSAGLIIFGTFLVYSSIGTVSFSELRCAFLARSDINLVTSSTGLAFILLGFFFKLSAFPAHLWAVEIYEGSTAPIMLFFLLPMKAAVLIVFVRFLNTAGIGLSSMWSPCLTIACSGSLLWGAFAALYERKISRLLGYASINQIGYLLLAAVGDTDAAMRSLAAYLVLYIMMSGGFFLIYMHGRRHGKLPFIYVSDFRGFAAQEPVLNFALTAVLFSSAGIPPLAGFDAKYIVLEAAMQKDLRGPALYVIISSLPSVCYYLQFVSVAFEDANAAVPARAALSADARAGLNLLAGLLVAIPFFGQETLLASQAVCESLLTCALVSFHA
jgi:NADH-quinone oxidoreductase subunit N